MKETSDLDKRGLSGLDWWEPTEESFVFVVCENTKYLWVVELFPEQPAETVQTPDRLLAALLARERSNSWMMEGRGRGPSQTIEPMQHRPVPEQKRGGGRTENSCLDVLLSNAVFL